jgi:hypothetical protein
MDLLGPLHEEQITLQKQFKVKNQNADKERRSQADT